MAFWGRNRWITEGKGVAPPVDPWVENRVEAAGYRLSVGKEVYTNGQGDEVLQKLDEGQGFVVAPGQFAFILTGEKVRIPKGSIGFISIRASIKFLGLVNVSGFQVNPGFCGNLIFAVFNAGPKHIHLKRQDEIFSLWIADLDEKVSDDFEDKGKIPNDLKEIPSSVINGIAGKALTAYQLSENLNLQEKRIEKLEAQLHRQKVILGIVFTIVFGIGVKLLIPIFSDAVQSAKDLPPQIEQTAPVSDAIGQSGVEADSDAAKGQGND